MYYNLIIKKQQTASEQATADDNSAFKTLTRMKHMVVWLVGMKQSIVVQQVWKQNQKEKNNSTSNKLLWLM